jgi:hypothetical protein
VNRFLILGAASAAFVAGVGIWHAVEPDPNGRQAVTRVAAAIPPTEPVPKIYTPEDFRRHISLMNKAEVRKEFGAPDQVRESDDTWFYARPPVVDPDAGVKINGVFVQFEGLDGPSDSVVDVRM